MELYEFIFLSKKMFFLSVPGLVEHESIPGITSSRPIGSKGSAESHDSPLISVEMVVKEINAMVMTLRQNYVDPEIVSQIIRQVHTIRCTKYVALNIPSIPAPLLKKRAW